jgi:hypothetical protein
MQNVLAFFRNIGAFIVGIFAAIAVIALARELAFGAGLAPSPVGLSAATQVVVILGWFAGAALGSWLAFRLAGRYGPGIVMCVWLFIMVWVSPGVRPAEFGIQLACALAVALAGFRILMWPRAEARRLG